MPGNFVRCHIRIVQPAAEPHPLSSAAGRRTQVHRDAYTGALQQQLPLFASRASPKRPTDQSIRSIIAVILLLDRNARNQTRFTPGKKNVIENCVHALAHKGRGGTADEICFSRRLFRWRRRRRLPKATTTLTGPARRRRRG